MKVEIIPCLSDNFSYLIHDKESDKVSIVDPAEFKACDNVIKKYFWSHILNKNLNLI